MQAYNALIIINQNIPQVRLIWQPNRQHTDTASTQRYVYYWLATRKLSWPL